MVYNIQPSQYFKQYGFEKTEPLYPFGYGLSYSNLNIQIYSVFIMIKNNIKPNV